MVKQSYGQYIKPFRSGECSREKARGGQVPFTRVPGTGVQTVRMSGGEHLGGIDLGFTWALHNDAGSWYGVRGPHVHPYPEVHLFVGMDTASINYLGAEVEVRLGEEMESYTFSEPAVIVIPAGMPHGPAITKRIYSPRGFGFCSVSLAPEFITEWLDVPPAEGTGSRYSHLVKPLKPFIVRQSGRQLTGAQSFDGEVIPGPGYAHHLARMNGDDLEGLNVSLEWGFASSPGLWHRGAGSQVRDADGMMIFAGTDPAHVNSLGAEIEMDIGSEHERYLVDSSSAVVCPAGTPYAPIVTRWVDRPFAFFSACLSAVPDVKFADDVNEGD